MRPVYIVRTVGVYVYSAHAMPPKRTEISGVIKRFICEFKTKNPTATHDNIIRHLKMILTLM